MSAFLGQFEFELIPIEEHLEHPLQGHEGGDLQTRKLPFLLLYAIFVQKSHAMKGGFEYNPDFLVAWLAEVAGVGCILDLASLPFIHWLSC